MRRSDGAAVAAMICMAGNCVNNPSFALSVGRPASNRARRQRSRPLVVRHFAIFDQPSSVRSVGRTVSYHRDGAALAASNELHAVPASTRRIVDSDNWHVWRTADKLERDGLSLGDGMTDDDATRELTLEVVSILRGWGSTWAGRLEWRGLLNKSSLTHEVEESIVALRSLLAWMNGTRREDGPPVVIVDVCCGKGVLSMLASYVFRGDPRVDRIVMLDRADIKWDHVDAANEHVEKGDCDTDGDGDGRRPPIEAWGGCNLHDVDIVADRLRALDAPCLLVGIHLCKMLSPACVGVANVLGPSVCPFLCLAPCCLPRAVLSGGESKRNPPAPRNDDDGERIGGKTTGGAASSIEVRQYESQSQAEDRRRAKERRDGAMTRRPALDCYLCRSSKHPVHGCSLLPAEEGERIDVFRRAAAAAPCWKCGEAGHFKADCPSDQSTGKPPLLEPPKESVDVSDVLASDAPFEEYCRRLAEAIQRDDVRLEDAGLVSGGAQHQQAANWNGRRKSIYITASR